jgi:Uma2 family endonuclease
MTISLDQPVQPNILHRHDVTWRDYLAIRDSETFHWQKIAFHQNWLWADMGFEGPGHARFSDLMTAILFFWAYLHPEASIESLGRCLLEVPNTEACSPNLVVYQGDDIPRWEPGQARRIDLSTARKPNLVGEVGDTTLSIDLDEQKQLYASLGIPEYWVIDVKGARIFAFGLSENGVYQAIETSQVLTGLPIALLEQTLTRLETSTNTAAANWLMQQLSIELG